MIQKLLHVMLVLGVLASILVGCGPADTSTPAAPEPTSAAVDEPAGDEPVETEPPATDVPQAEEEEREAVALTLAHVQGEWLWPVLEELAAMYNEVSGNTVELLYVPADGWAEWLQAQLVAGTEPDIIWMHGDAASLYRNQQIIDLRPYFESVSPYTGAPWQDSFLEGLLAGVIDPDGGEGMIGMPLAQVTVNLYYNRDIFAEAGLPDEAPLSWTGVLEACQTVQAEMDDVTPFAVMNSISWNLGWFRPQFMEDLYVNSGIVEKLDIITPNGKLENTEIALGLKTGVIDPEDPRFVDYYAFMKELSQCFNKGFNVVSWEYEKLFLDGQAAMWLNGSWFPNQLLTADVDLNYGVGPIPYVDDAVSEFSRNQAMKYALGVGAPNVLITKRAADEGRAEAAVNFLQFWSDPATGAEYFVENTMFLPVVKNVAVPAEMQGIVDWIGDAEQVTNVNAVWALTPESGDKYSEMFKVFLEDDTSAEDFAADVADILLDAADQYIMENPDLDIESYVDQVQ